MNRMRIVPSPARTHWDVLALNLAGEWQRVHTGDLWGVLHYVKDIEGKPYQEVE